MFITEEQARARLSSDKNLANRFTRGAEGRVEERVIKLPGKKLGSKNLSIEERTEIAVESRLGGKIEEIASEHKVAAITVAKIKSSARDSGEINEAKTEEIISRVKDRALDRLMQSLGLIDNDKLSGCSAKDLSIIASNMGRVVEKISPREDRGQQVNVILYAPELKKENSFDSVEI